MEQKKRVLINSGIKLLSKSQVLKHISNDTYDKIKKTDTNPMFIMCSVGYEGESTGVMYEGDVASGKAMSQWYKQLWPLKAVKQLIGWMKKDQFLPIYEAHEPSVNARTVVGSLVSSTKKTIKGVTHAIGIGYINNYGTRQKIKAGEFDACSLEANCVFEESDNLFRYIVREVVELFGIALCNSEVNPTGFDDSKILAVVTAMAKKRDDDDDDDDDYSSGKRRKRRDEMVTLRDVKEFIENNQTSPTSLFSVETLTKLPGVVGAFENDFQEKQKGKDKEIKDLKAELGPFKLQAARGKTSELIRKSELLKDEYKEVVEYLTKTMHVDVEGVDDPQKVVDEAIKSNLQTMQEANFKTKTGEAGGKNKKKDDKNKDENKNKGKTGLEEDDTDDENSDEPDYTKAKDNDLIPA